MPKRNRRTQWADMPKRNYSLTQEWLSADGRELRLGDRVRSRDGLEGVVLGRWTKRDGMIPMVSGLIPVDGKDSVGKGAEHVARPAAECRHALARRRPDDDEVSL